MSEKYYEFTREGILELQHELEHRKTTVSQEVAERLREARAMGDLSENSEYDDAKEQQAENEAKIAEIEALLKKARVIDESEISKTEVSLGSLVIVEDLELEEKQEYRIVSPNEENIFNGKLSSKSPLGEAIMGHKKGETVQVKTPLGYLKYKIIDIARPKSVKKHAAEEE